MINLPSFVQESTIFSDDEKRILSSVSSIPTDAEVDAIRFLPEIQELTNAFIGDESTRDTHLQLKAKHFLAEGDIEMAWKVMLL